jgi:hypothetical protein
MPCPHHPYRLKHPNICRIAGKFLITQCSPASSLGPLIRLRTLFSNTSVCLRFVVFTAVRMMCFWVLTPCTLVNRCQRFGETNCLCLQGWRRTSPPPPRSMFFPLMWHQDSHPYKAMIKRPWSLTLVTEIPRYIPSSRLCR